MSNICDTQYKVRGSRKALSDLWNTLQMMGVNSKDVYLYKLAEHYGIDYEHSCISVRGHIYWAEFEDNKDGGLLSFDTESAWTACDLFFDELNKVLGNELSISYREIECGCEIFYVHDEGGFFPEECCVSSSGGHLNINELQKMVEWYKIPLSPQEPSERDFRKLFSYYQLFYLYLTQNKVDYPKISSIFAAT